MFKSKKVCQQEIIGVLQNRSETFLTALTLCQKEPDEKNVHDLRVSARRLRAILELIGEIKNVENIKKINRKTKKVLKTFSGLRDIQVQQLFLRDVLSQFPNVKNLVQRLEIKEKEEIEQSIKNLEKLDKRKLQKDLKGLNKKVDTFIKRKNVQGALETLLEKDFNRVIKSKRALDLEHEETFHRLRIDCKKLRYRMEIIEPLLVENSEITKPLKNIQDKLGEIQDMTVLLSEIEQSPELLTEEAKDTSFKDWLNRRLFDKMKTFYEEREALFEGFNTEDATKEDATKEDTTKEEAAKENTTKKKVTKKNTTKAVPKMGDKNKSEKLCKLANKKGYLEENMKEYITMVEEPKYLCKKCGRVAKKEKQLCKPKKIN